MLILETAQEINSSKFLLGVSGGKSYLLQPDQLYILKPIRPSKLPEQLPYPKYPPPQYYPPEYPPQQFTPPQYIHSRQPYQPPPQPPYQSKQYAGTPTEINYSNVRL